MTDRRNDILVFMPTYNEAGHVEQMLERIRATGVSADVMFLDDNSTDGTAEIIDHLTEIDDAVFVIHRTGKLGIGSAHRVGINHAYEAGYRILITMDADLVHRPEDIPSFMDAGNAHDIVVGNRFVQKDSLAEWNLFRKTLTRAGHIMTRLLLRHNFDATGAFRLYRLDTIDRQIFESVRADNYEFFFTSLTVLHLNGCSIAEVPVLLPSRVYGTSKMELKHIFKSVFAMLRLGMQVCLARKSLLLGSLDK
jgi:dolichol-phosphate mannosyltransferase